MVSFPTMKLPEALTKFLQPSKVDRETFLSLLIDVHSITTARWAIGARGIPEIFTSRYIESNQQNFEYRPMVLTTFAIEYQFFGSNPQISHFVNVSIYALTCVLLFVILFGLLSSYHFIFPLLITFLFIAHPIHTEVVNNLK